MQWIYLTITLYFFRIFSPLNKGIIDLNIFVLSAFTIEIPFVQKTPIFEHLDHLNRSYFTFWILLAVKIMPWSSNIFLLWVYLLDILEEATETMDIPSWWLFYLSF